MPEPIRVGVIGLGFMGSTHARCYQSAAAAGWPCRLAAVADRSPDRLTGLAAVTGNIATGPPDRLFDPALVRTFTDPVALIADPSIDAVSICTHTRTHVDLAIAALRAGKHVLVEKPLALDIADAQRLIPVAAAHPQLVCMPAMVMRFWPGWPMVRDAIRSHTHGPLRALTLTRRGSTPPWSPDFYANPAESGGALFDLHVHDADFILWCLGTPTSVTSTGDERHVTTIYRYPHIPHVVAEGGTDHDPAHGFHIRLTAVFERATIDFDLSRTPNLIISTNSVKHEKPAPPEGPFDLELRAFLDAIGGRTQPVPVTDAVAAIRLLHAERQSLIARQPVLLDASMPPSSMPSSARSESPRADLSHPRYTRPA